ncbi:hypothetical protein Pan216_25480 [Planctomycetes bacterium Pan216]|uniref:Uncharacterized protein n=1 Tax=Kolteria novifilia TaxID=2527975 RepID=A0A518B441_9BACT|nr:hypothetical protein Pan216_25480 [Planctomycetes bacterium Pan216]
MESMLFEFSYFGKSLTSDVPYVSVTDSEEAQRAEVCDVCGHQWKVLRGSVSLNVEGGRYWPDIMRVDGKSPMVVVSSRVMDGFVSVGIRGFASYEARVVGIDSDTLSLEKCPTYYYLELCRGIDVDPDASGIELEYACRACPRLSKIYDANAPLVPDLSTWEGLDVFTFRNIRSQIRCCTLKVVELARQHRWSNFFFQFMGANPLLPVAQRKIDYLGEMWPPTGWPPWTQKM